MASNGHGNIDILRKAAIVVVLLAAMWLLHRFGLTGEELHPTTMLALGFVVLASYTFGELVGAVKLPHITGYLIAGVVLGGSTAGALGWLVAEGPAAAAPYLGPAVTAWLHGIVPPGTELPPPFDKGILDYGVVEELSLFNTLAVSLIALTAGGELKLKNLREGLRDILAVMAGHLGMVTAMMALFGFIIAGGIGPALALPFLSGSGPAMGGLDPLGTVLLVALFAVVATATSPAATVAVITSAKAEGPVTSTSLAAVVLLEVVIVLLFGIIGAIAGGYVDPAALVDAAAHAATADHATHDEDPMRVGAFALSLTWHVVGSLVAGSAIGLGIAAYLRYVRIEVLLMLVALVFAVAWIGSAADLDTTMMFIAAGFTTTNFSHEGDKLVHEVEKLGLPVYVVFFTLAGASLHLDSLVTLAPFVAGLVGLRIFGVYFGIRTATRLAGSSEPVQRYAWMGFVSQAGIAIGLASLVGERFGDVGTALRDLAIAGVAIHEVIGPVLFKAGLGLAGEVPASRRGAAPDAGNAKAVDANAPMRVWTPPEGVEDPWGEHEPLASERLDEVAGELRAELGSLAQDVENGALAAWADEAQEYLNALRKEFLRHHRHLTVAAAEGRSGIDANLRIETSALADRWRDVVLARAAEVRRPGWSPLDLIETLDDTIGRLPEDVPAPLEPETLRGPDDEPGWQALQRAALRARIRVARVVTGSEPRRRAAVQLLTRYHFGGLLPARLEGLAALFVSADQHLHRRTRSLFHTITHAYDALARGTAGDPAEALQDVRRDVEDEFTLARDELLAIRYEGGLRAARILGRTYRGWLADLRRIGTLDLRPRARRYSRVFRQRTRGIELLQRGMAGARTGVAARYTALALDLELAKLEGRISDLVDQHADQLARRIRGKGNTQLARVESALRDALVAITEVMAEDLPPTALARRLREAATPLQHVTEDAARAASRLRSMLSDDQALSALLDSLVAASRDLTERYTVPTGAEREGEWALPPETATVDIPLRDVVQAFIESSITRKLGEVSNTLATEAEALVTTLEEFDRLVAFNIELATGELELVDGKVPIATKELVHDMVLGNLGRSRGRLEATREATEGWSERAADAVRAAVLGELDELRAQIHDGKVSELRIRIVREAAAGRRLVRQAGGLRGVVRGVVDAAGDVARSALGDDGIARAERTLGLRRSQPDRRPAPTSFAPARIPEALPLVYRRLFSDVAMEAGDLLTGRRAELDRARRVLDGEAGGRLRSVALVGPAGVGKRAMVNTLVRKVDTRNVTRIHLTAPTTPDEVTGWFQADQRDRLVVIEGFEWLFSMEPQGMEPLRAFTRGLVRDDGRNRWLVQADLPVWRFANRVAELQDAFADVIDITPLTPEGLAQAILARHGMSGYSLEFQGTPSLAAQLRAVLRPAADPSQRARDLWFHELHAATGGLLNDALHLWMASVAHVDEDRSVVIIGDVPTPPIGALRALPDDDLLTLRQVARQGTMPVATHAWLFSASEVRAEAHLGHLGHLGLLCRSEAGYSVAPHLRGPLTRVLAERGWTE
jgi:Kef-type K+ transport system membrane component KefB